MRNIFIVFMLSVFFIGCATTLPSISRTFKIDFDKLPFELPIEFSCNGKVVKTQGVGLCQQNQGTDSWVKFKLPPSEGQFRATDCHDNLLPITDFNYLKKKGGFLWLFEKKVLSDDTYTINLGKLNPTVNSCPIVISLAGKNTGVQKAILYYYVISEKNMAYDQEVFYDCVQLNKKTENGMGKCYRYSGSPFNMYINVKPEDKGVIYATSPYCSYTETKKYTGVSKVEFRLPYVTEGYCPIEIIHTRKVDGLIVDTRAAIKLIAIDPGIYGIDKPHILKIKNKAKLWKPLFAELVQVNYYRADGSLGKTVIVDKNNYAIENDWPRICAHAYSNERRGSYSEACYTRQELENLEEIKEIGEADIDNN